MWQDNHLSNLSSCFDNILGSKVNLNYNKEKCLKYFGRAMENISLHNISALIYCFFIHRDNF